MLKINFKLNIIPILMFYCSTFLNAQIILRDDFKENSNYWFFREDGNQSVPIVKDGTLQLKLIDAVESEYCNTEIYDPTEPYQSGTILRTRIKASPQHIGSRGWGFWDGDLTLIDIFLEYDVAWIMQQKSLVSDEKYNWFLFGVASDSLSNKKTVSLQNKLNENEWHTYKIIWDENITSLYVDDELFYLTNSNIPDDKMRFDVWIDNRVINIEDPSKYWNNNSNGSSIFVDYVEITGLNGTEISRNTFGNILFWDSPNSYPNGKKDNLWKEYNFFVGQQSEVLIYISGNAENYAEFGIDDDLKIVINGIDYGWDNQNSLNGKMNNGNGYAISLPVNLSSGNHNLKIYTDETPFVSDIIVVNSPNGKLIYNNIFNQIANDEDGFFKNIDFEVSENSEITCLLSFDMNSKDDINIMIDDKAIDLTNQKKILGNELQKRTATFVINELLTSGKHSLKIFKTGSPKLVNVSVYSPSTITDIDNNLNDNFEFEFTVYPNPFNITTNINYKISQPTNVKIRIYNLLGELIEEVINDNHIIGYYNFEWNAENVSSGIYLFTISTNNYFESKKVILLK
ncbi:MAG: T9SS type A sorting domain-containing protein [Ignavibacteriae bacterium]|nr:T9SS type A sorting domain-containing protein [Ignavibacteriota bacterium]